MSALADRLRTGLLAAYAAVGLDARAQGPDMLVSVMLTPKPLRSVRDLYDCDTATLMQLRTLLRARGVYTRPSPCYMWYMSTAHTEADVDTTLGAVGDALRELVAASVA